jgi:hypothetical protein
MTSVKKAQIVKVVNNIFKLYKLKRIAKFAHNDLSTNTKPFLEGIVV